MSLPRYLNRYAIDDEEALRTARIAAAQCVEDGVSINTYNLRSRGARGGLPRVNRALHAMVQAGEVKVRRYFRRPTLTDEEVMESVRFAAQQCRSDGVGLGDTSLRERGARGSRPRLRDALAKLKASGEVVVKARCNHREAKRLVEAEPVVLAQRALEVRQATLEAQRVKLDAKVEPVKPEAADPAPFAAAVREVLGAERRLRIWAELWRGEARGGDGRGDSVTAAALTIGLFLAGVIAVDELAAAWRRRCEAERPVVEVSKPWPEWLVGVKRFG